MIRCAVLGAKGYTGCELIQILVKHPDVEISFLGSRDAGTLPVSELLPQVVCPEGLIVEQINTQKILETSDVIFLALPHTKAIEFVKEFSGNGKVIIDLSADYRFKDKNTYETWYKVEHSAIDLLEKAVYGLPELNRSEIEQAEIIANPGCYPTAVLLSLLPLIKNDLIELDTVYVDAKSGYSGAGKKMPEHVLRELSENFYAYKVGAHQHMPEMVEVLQSVNRAFKQLTFVPHLLPVYRGILASVYARISDGVTADMINQAFLGMYKSEPFVRLKDAGSFPTLKEVALTNYCDIGIKCDADTGSLVVISTIDNLVKGASGQAVQNMNIRFGFDEKAGLL